MDHNDKEHAALNAFGQLWKEKFAEDSLLVLSTGRSHALYEELRVRLLCPASAAGRCSSCIRLAQRSVLSPAAQVSDRTGGRLVPHDEPMA